MLAIVKDDIVAGFASGDAVGVPVPPECASLNPMQLRCVDGRIVDAGGVSTFHVDGAGLRHVAPAEGRQALSCRWDSHIVRGGDGLWRVVTDAEARAPEIRAECTRRIQAVLSEPTQRNLTAYAADIGLGAPEVQPGDVATMRAARLWVSAMQAACRAAVASGAEPVWPNVPDGVVALAERF